MSTAVLVRNRSNCASNHRFCVHPEGHEPFLLLAEQVEARIQRICDRCKDLDWTSQPVQLKNGLHTYSPELDLCVKVEAVRWMLRIAKRMNEPAREVVLLRAENSLRKLEATVESCAYRAPSPASAETIHRWARA
jgi:hypothetical protein